MLINTCQNAILMTARPEREPCICLHAYVRPKISRQTNCVPGTKTGEVSGQQQPHLPPPGGPPCHLASGGWTRVTTQHRLPGRSSSESASRWWPALDVGFQCHRVRGSAGCTSTEVMWRRRLRNGGAARDPVISSTFRRSHRRNDVVLDDTSGGMGCGRSVRTASGRRFRPAVQRGRLRWLRCRAGLPM